METEGKDIDKSKEQLKQEIEALKARLAELERIASKETDSSALEKAVSVSADMDGLSSYDDKYKILVENSLEGIYICQEGVIIYCNHRLAEMFGYKHDTDLLGVRLVQLVSERSRDLVRREVAERESGKKLISHYTFRARRKDKHEFDVEVLGSRIVYKGKPAVQGVLRDVSEQRELERQLRHSQKMEAIGTLAGGIAHDFNNILGVIIGYIELSRDEAENFPGIKRNLDQILKASDRAKELVDQILSFSRQTERERRPVQLNPIITEVLKLMRASLPSTIRIDKELSEKNYVVMGDSTQLHQVLMNLCTNAAHAMKEKGGVLKVDLSDFNRDLGLDISDTPAPYLRLSVSDTGHGMPPEVMERVFDPFFTTKKTGEGTGLGLSVVHGIIRSLDGEISVESKVNEGTTFHIFIPILEEGIIKNKRISREVTGGSERILLVDDETTLATMAASMLQRLGYHVVPATDSLEALETFRKAPLDFDLVITDLTMPNMTGKQLAQEISRIRRDIPIILCTGFKRGIDTETIKDYGIHALLMKPYGKKDMADVVRKVLEK